MAGEAANNNKEEEQNNADDNSMEVEDEGYDSCNEEPSFIIGEQEKKIWKYLMQVALNRMGNITVDDLTVDENLLKEFVEILGDLYERWLFIICKSKNKTIYSSIKETIDSHINNGYLPSEAAVKAWKDRRLLFKSILPIIFS